MEVEIDAHSTLDSIGLSIFQQLGIEPPAEKLYYAAHEAMKTENPKHILVHLTKGTPDAVEDIDRFFSYLRGSTQDRRAIPLILAEDGARSYLNYNTHWVGYSNIDAPKP